MVDSQRGWPGHDRRLYSVSYLLRDGLSDRHMSEVTMTRAEARQMRQFLAERGMQYVEVREMDQVMPPMTYAEAMQWIRRDF